MSNRESEDFDFLDDLLAEEPEEEKKSTEEGSEESGKTPSSKRPKVRNSGSNIPDVEDAEDRMLREMMDGESFKNQSKMAILKKVAQEDDFSFVVVEEKEVEDVLVPVEIAKDPSKLSAALKAAEEWNPPFPRTTIDLLENEWHSTGWVGFLHIDHILTQAVLTNSSDVHIAADAVVSMTTNGDIVRLTDLAIPDEETMHELIHNGILTHQQQSEFNKNFEYEGAYTLRHGPLAGSRTRLTLGKTFGKYFMVFRIISDNIPELSKLGVDDELVRWSKYPNGLMLLCGPTGSGKTTTLASIIHNLQKTTQKKIITIEKPIEFIYPDDTPSLVVQRSVGEDTRGFYEGLTSAMRQSPNVILLGEVRNTEEVTELLRAAETGHLAISTMHTNSVATTINRIQNLFSGNEQLRIMSTLADTLRGVANQVLVKTIDGKGRFAIRETLTVNDTIRDLIIKGDIRGIRKYQIEHKATIEHKLATAIKEKKCTVEDALDHVSDMELFNKLLKE